MVETLGTRSKPPMAELYNLRDIPMSELYNLRDIPMSELYSESDAALVRPYTTGWRPPWLSRVL